MRGDRIAATLARWELDVVAVRERVYQAATPRERERWHALWLRAQGWTAGQVAAALGRDAHTVGDWLEAFERDGPAALAFEQTGGSPPRWKQASKRR
jgi:transposase